MVLEQRVKQRLIGAVVLVALGVIFLPMLLSGPVERTRVDIDLDIPAEPELPEAPAVPENNGLAGPSPGSELADTPIPDEPDQLPEAEPLPEVEKPAEDEPDAEGQGSNASDGGPAEPAEATSGRGVYVQVGAFGSIENARRLADRLRDDGFELRIVERDGDLAHRVQVGPLEDRSAAEAMSQRLAEGHELPGFIVEP
jgi:cell division septation protein DedD